MASDSVLHSVIAEAGYDADDILQRANSPEIKLDLRARTKEAKDRGICGAPSYTISRRKVGSRDQAWKPTGDIIWGQDEMFTVEDLICGWDSQSPVLEAGRDIVPQKSTARL
jgi:2-hydroxychromene-2-carboxylate isomerase